MYLIHLNSGNYLTVKETVRAAVESLDNNNIPMKYRVPGTVITISQKIDQAVGPGKVHM